MPDDAALSVSVVICAYTERRWDDVLAAIESVRIQRLPAHEIILVVDHNPTLFARLRAELPDVLVVENRHLRGLSGGKNTGVGLATGEVVAFLDDDAVAEPGWLGHLLAGYVEPEVMGVGGLTLPLWETGRPTWLPEEFDWTVGCTFVGREPGRVRNLLGGNASFRREAFVRAGGFPEGIGRSAADRRPLGCEETEFCIRLAQRIPGSVFVYDAGAVIHHRVPRQRERFGYFRTRCFSEGLSKAQVTRSVGVADGLSAERRYARVTLRRGATRGLRDAVRGDLAGLARSGAIASGLLFTTAGFALGTLRGAVTRVTR
ncbi:glycosyltransferase family 2 protein [Pseudonocardia sp.]|uniref:glycosyltransferase family 2 protein n=1 Tax=Pseudonocardia sp. TaxID=60912 RepID=UPI003D0A311D